MRESRSPVGRCSCCWSSTGEDNQYLNQGPHPTLHLNHVNNTCIQCPSLPRVGCTQLALEYDVMSFFDPLGTLVVPYFTQPVAMVVLAMLSRLLHTISCGLHNATGSAGTPRSSPMMALRSTAAEDTMTMRGLAALNPAMPPAICKVHTITLSQPSWGRALQLQTCSDNAIRYKP